MYEQLKVFGLKALQEQTLENLGRINVICGKNNSGKSTVLEAINTSQRWPGKKLQDENFDQIHHELSQGSTLTVRVTDDQGKSSNRKIQETQISHEILSILLQEIQSPEQIWFYADADRFQQIITDACRNPDLIAQHSKEFNNKGLSIIRLNMGKTPEVAFKSLFNSVADIKSILIPPKRQLELAGKINTKINTLPPGEGILNALHVAKNELPDSPLYSFYTTISAAFNFVSSGHSFHVKVGTENDLSLYFSYNDGRWVEAKDCGMGFQDLLIILYYAIHPINPIILIEEPESHLHPDMQHKLLYYLATKIDNKQFFLATHSNVFLSSPYINRVFYTYIENQTIKIDDATSKALILKNLGYSVTDNLISDLIILVEGPTDISFMEEFLIKLDLFGKYNIKMWPLGGDIMDSLDLSVFAQHYHIIALVDNDPGSERVRRRFIENCQQYSIPVHRLERYSIENYYSLLALRAVFGPQIDENITEIKPDVKLETQIKLSTKKQSRNIAREMELSDVQGTDLGDFFEMIRSNLSTA